MLQLGGDNINSNPCFGVLFSFTHTFTHIKIAVLLARWLRGYLAERGDNKTTNILSLKYDPKGPKSAVGLE